MFLTGKIGNLGNDFLRRANVIIKKICVCVYYFFLSCIFYKFILPILPDRVVTLVNIGADVG